MLRRIEITFIWLVGNFNRKNLKKFLLFYRSLVIINNVVKDELTI